MPRGELFRNSCVRGRTILLKILLLTCLRLLRLTFSGSDINLISEAFYRLRPGLARTDKQKKNTCA
jgi:hypothetical protein